jgi:hypothetical protein
MWMIRPQRRSFICGTKGAREHHASAEIEFNDAVPILIFHLVNGTRNVGSCVIHQNIHATHLLKRSLGQTFCVAALRQVHSDNQAAPASAFQNFGQGFLQLVGMPAA